MKQIFILFFLWGNAVNAAPITNEAELLKYQCSAFAENASEIKFQVSSLNNKGYRDKRLYLFSDQEMSKNWIVVDVTSSDNIIPDTLKIPLHALKYKKYLANKQIILLGDGINYAQLEETSVRLKQYFVEDIKIYFGGVSNWNKEANTKPLAISASEFAAESNLGNWFYIKDESELVALLKEVKADNSSHDSLDRYLLLSDVITGRLLPNALSYQFFELEGGKQALDQLSVNQGRILSAIQERELRSRCKGTPSA